MTPSFSKHVRICIPQHLYHFLTCMFRPVMRSDREVEKLASHLEFFSSLFPIPDENISTTEFYTGLAQRATLEKFPGEGYASMYTCISYIA